MTTRAGVGYSENPNSRQAGVEAARAALSQAGINRCDLVLLFSTSRHDPVQLREGVRAVVGPETRLVGGYGIGIITNDRLGYEGYQVGVGVFSSDSMRIDLFLEHGLDEDEFRTGVALGNQIRSAGVPKDSNILVLYDSIKRSVAEGMSLNLATPLVEGMTESLGEWPAAAGGGMIGDMHFNPTHQWFDDRIEQKAAMALVLSGGVRMDTIIMHGWVVGHWRLV